MAGCGVCSLEMRPLTLTEDRTAPFVIQAFARALSNPALGFLPNQLPPFVPSTPVNTKLNKAVTFYPLYLLVS
jgi:hypothetical protein